MAQVYLSKVAFAQKRSQLQLLLPVKQDYKVLHHCDPALKIFFIVDIEVYHVALCKQDEAVHAFLWRFLQNVFLKSAILDVKDTALLSIILILNNDKSDNVTS